MNSPKYRQGELYLSLADRLKGEQPHTLLEWKQSQQAEAEKAIVLHDQAIVEQQRQEAEIQQEKESLSGTLSKKETVPTFEEAEELSKQVDSKDKADVYKGIVESHIARLEKDGKITEKDKHKIRKAYIRKESWDGRLNSALAKLREFENPPTSGRRGFSVEEAEKYQKARANLVSMSRAGAGLGTGLSQKLKTFDRLYKEGRAEELDAFIEEERVHILALNRLANARSMDNVPEEKLESLVALSKQSSKVAPDKWAKINDELSKFGVPGDLAKTAEAGQTGAVTNADTAAKVRGSEEEAIDPVEAMDEAEAGTGLDPEEITEDEAEVSAYTVQKEDKIKEALLEAINNDRAMSVNLSEPDLEYALTEGSTSLKNMLRDAYEAVERRNKAEVRSFAKKSGDGRKEPPAPKKKDAVEELKDNAPEERSFANEKKESVKKQETKEKNPPVKEKKAAAKEPAKGKTKAVKESAEEPVKEQEAEEQKPAEKSKQSSDPKETISDLENVDDLKAFDKAEKKVRQIVQAARNYIDGTRKKKLAANQVGLLESLNEKGYLVAEEAQALDDYKAFIAKKEGKTVRHASRSARTQRQVDSHVRYGVPNSVEGAIQRLRSFLGGETGSTYINFLIVNDAVAEQVENVTGIDVHGFAFRLTNESVVHVKNHHGNATYERARGQKEWTEKDYENLPEILNNPDKVSSADYPLQGQISKGDI